MATGQMNGLPYKYTPPKNNTAPTGQMNGLPYKYTPPKTTPTKSTPTYTAPKTNAAKTSTPSWVPSGIVEESAPEWLGSGMQTTGGADDQNSLIDNYADTQSKQLLASLRAAYDQNRNDLNAQKPMIQQEAAGMRNSADTNYFTNDLQNLYKAMEAGGQKGGENITGMVSANATRGNGRNNADLYEANNLRNIDNAINNLDSQQSQAEAQGLMGIGSDTFAAKLQSMRDAVTQANTLRQQEKADYTNTVGAYADDYMKQINNLRAQGVPDTDYRVKVLFAARNQKISDQQAAAKEAEQQNFTNSLALAKLQKARSGGGSTSDLTESDVNSLYNSGLIDYDTAQQLLKNLGVL